MNEKVFNDIVEKAQAFKYTSMQYVDYENLARADILCDNDECIILLDTGKSPATLHFAVNNFEALSACIADLNGAMRICFVPYEFATALSELGFTEWGEYVDYFNDDLTQTALNPENIKVIEYLQPDECVALSLMSKRLEMSSRGFTGETSEWFSGWIANNKVIILHDINDIVGYCCISIYNGGTMLWIRELGVDPVHQGKGFGKKLIEQAISYGINVGAKRGFLAVDVQNKTAIGLYKKYDFKQKGERGELQMVRK